MTHEKVIVQSGPRSELPIIVAVHSTRVGPAVGGIRMTTYPDWRDGLEDALRLSEAMTMKCAIAGLPHGGGKTVIALPMGTVLTPATRRDVMLDLGDVIHGLGGTYLAGQDVGTTADDMLVARERTPWAYGQPESAGGAGEPSEPTAIGVYESIKAVFAHLFGDGSPRGRRIVLIGLGQVGGRLARRLSTDGAELTVTDVDAAKRALAADLGATWVDVESAPFIPADLLVPAALGGLLTDAIVPHLACRAVCGPANNQLVSAHVAELLRDSGILWAPDFVVNGGGVLYGTLVDVAGVSSEEALKKVREIGEIVAQVLRLASENSLTTLEAAEWVAHARVGAE